MNNLVLLQQSQMHSSISGTNSQSVMSCSSCLWQQGQSSSLSSMIIGIGHQFKSFNCFKFIFKIKENIRGKYISILEKSGHVLS